jgi:hypothetical protein
VQTTDASGIQIRLQVPAGALARNTTITLTPLASSPLPNASSVMQFGIQFEPDGLRFALPATLTLDFSASRESVSARTGIFLLTAPLTTLPIYGTADPVTKTVTGRLYHFSSTDSGSGDSALMDLKVWADVLMTGGASTLAELESAVALVRQMQMNPDFCLTQQCPDLNVITQQLQQFLNVKSAFTCLNGQANPGATALHDLIFLDQLAQQVNLQIPGNTGCEHQILKVLIDAAGQAALGDPDPPYTDANDPKLLALRRSGSSTTTTWRDLAETLAFTDLIDLCEKYFVAAMKARINRTGDAADANATDPLLARLYGLRVMAQQLGETDLNTLAMQRLDQAIKTQADRDLTQAEQPLGTDPIEAALADLKRLSAFVQKDTDLATFDPTLPTLLQQYIDKANLELLIARASKDPGIPLPDPATYITGNAALTNLGQLLTQAKQRQFPDLQTKVLQVLDNVLRTAAQRLVSDIQGQSPSSPLQILGGSPKAAASIQSALSASDISTDTQDAIADLNQEQQIGDGDGVPSVDPDFDSFIQQEINTLKSVTFTVNSGDGFFPHGSGPCGFEPAFGIPPYRPFQNFVLPLPVTFGASGCGGAKLQMTVKSVSNNAVEFDVNGNGSFEGIFSLGLTTTAPSTLQVDFNSSWLASTSVLNGSTYAAVTVYDSQGNFIFNSQGGVNQATYGFINGVLDNRLFSFPGGTYLISLLIRAEAPDYAEVYTGTGRVLTLTVK